MKQAEIRNKTFWIISIPLFCFLTLLEYYNWYDSALLIYSLVVFFVTLCLCFWIFWGFISIRPLSAFFKIILLLMMGIDYVWISSLYSRYLYATNLEEYLKWMKSDIFAYRPIIILFTFVWILSWIIGKFFVKQREIDLSLYENRLLIVDDEKGVVNLIKNCAQSVNISNIDCAHDYKSAMGLFETGKYICVLIDLKLTSSVKDGAVLAADIRKKDPYVIIGILTGFVSTIQAELLTVIDDVIEKPFSPNLLKVKLRLLYCLGQKKRSLASHHIDKSKEEIYNADL